MLTSLLQPYNPSAGILIGDVLSLISSLRSSFTSQGALLVFELSQHDRLLLAWTLSLPANTLRRLLQVNLRGHADTNINTSEWNTLQSSLSVIKEPHVNVNVWMCLFVSERHQQSVIKQCQLIQPGSSSSFMIPESSSSSEQVTDLFTFISRYSVLDWTGLDSWL